MKKIIQNILNSKKIKGNCYPTVIACFMDLDSPEEVIQIQEYYPKDLQDSSWIDVLHEWLEKRGWEIEYLDNHLFDDTFYAVSGKTVRDTTHICIYKNGKLYHDPHPDGDGLLTETGFQLLRKAETNAVIENES